MAQLPSGRAAEPGRAPSRRDRVRATTTDEIKATARRILVADGPDALSLRAIAREMGMTAPAIYRYFGSREELLKHVIADMFVELSHDIQAAVQAVGRGSGDMTAKLMTAAWEFRRWSLNHPREFGLIFGSPLPGVSIEQDEITAEAGAEFGNAFFVLIAELWQRQPFPVPADEEIDPGMREQLLRYQEGLGDLAAGLPLGMLLVFLRCWVRLYGIVSLEVFGHLGFALDDGRPMFEIMLSEAAPLLGLTYPPPARRE